MAPIRKDIWPDPVDILIGDKIRTRRLKLGMSQGALGARLGITFQQIQKYEWGQNRVSAASLLQIAEALEVSPLALLPPQIRSPDDDRVLTHALRDGGLSALLQAWPRLLQEDREAITNLVLGLAQKRSGPRRGHEDRG